MISNKILPVLGRLLLLSLVLGMGGCGGGGGGASSAPTVNVSLPNVPGQNVLPIVVDAGPLSSTFPTVNVPYVSVTICAPGSSNCATIDHIIVDTGSSGLRILSTALPASIALTQQLSGGLPQAECLQFVDGYSWGTVKLADVKLAGEPVLSSLSIHVIGDASIPASPTTCSNALPSKNSVQVFGGNGIIGVGSFQQDFGLYFSCTATTCAAATIVAANQVQNPVGLLASDNNGVVISLPALPSTGATTVKGSLILGIGTQTNNALGTATVFPLNATNGTLTTVFNGISYVGSFIDSGSNALFFPDTTIAKCTVNLGFYCPLTALALSATIQGTTANIATVNFAVANADNLNGSYKAFSNLAGASLGVAGTFDWGLPFFFGRSVYTSIAGKSAGGIVGPFVAY